MSRNSIESHIQCASEQVCLMAMSSLILSSFLPEKHIQQLRQLLAISTFLLPLAIEAQIMAQVARG
jgi:hypothetical protein